MLKTDTFQAGLSGPGWLLHTPSDLEAAPAKVKVHCQVVPSAQPQEHPRQMLKLPALPSPTVLVLWL